MTETGAMLRPLAQPDPSRGPTLWRSATQHDGARHLRAADAPAAHAGRSRSPPLLRQVPRRGDPDARRPELRARRSRTGIYRGRFLVRWIVPWWSRRACCRHGDSRSHDSRERGQRSAASLQLGSATPRAPECWAQGSSRDDNFHQIGNFLLLSQRTRKQFRTVNASFGIYRFSQPKAGSSLPASPVAHFLYTQARIDLLIRRNEHIYNAE
jgi:hypothetical protein